MFQQFRGAEKGATQATMTADWRDAGSSAACTAPSSAISGAARFSAATTGALGGESSASAPLFSTGAAKRGLLRGGGVLATPCHGRAGLPSSSSTAMNTSRGAAGVDCLVNQGDEVPLDLTQIRRNRTRSRSR